MSSITIQKQTCQVNGYNMAYVESGNSTLDPIVFLHGNPTSSFLWRNVMAPLETYGRLIAPDLIGMGDSDKLSISDADSYGFFQHADFLDKFFECIGVKQNVILVIHDWGSALGFWWARRHPDAVKGIVYMEAMVQPLSFLEFPDGFEDFIRAVRTNGTGEMLVLEQNTFVENILPSGIARNLTEEEFAVYRAPYLEPGEGRRPTLTWPRELPIDGEPVDTHAMMTNYSEWMPNTEFPKLFVNTEPGSLLAGSAREYARTWNNQVEVTVQPGVHFIQEGHPEEIASAIADWMDMTFVTTTSSANTADSTAVAGFILLGYLARFFRW